MPEKDVLKSRFLKSLIIITLFFLILSLSLLFRFSNTRFNTPAYNLILVDNTENIDPIVLKSIPSAPSPSSCKESCSCNPNQARLKVFMYDLPPEFHFGLLGFQPNPNRIWPNVSNLTEIPSYPGGLNLQHSVAYWLTLDLLSSTIPNIHRPCTAIRVKNSTQSDIIFVPFFSSLSYNRNSKIQINNDKTLQKRLVKYLNNRAEWKRNGGKDHLIMAHHPNSMILARKNLSSAMVILSDFGRYPPQIANIDKDLIAPYKHVVKSINVTNSPNFEERPTLVYFRGAIYRKDGGVIRQELYYILKDEKDVYFTFGNVQGGGICKASKGMASSKFCLNIAGDTPSSNRLFDAIAAHCVPVIISDEIELPYEDVLDYSKFSVFVRASDACKKGYLLKILRGVKKEKWVEMWERLKEISRHFEYQFPSRKGDAVDMIWQAVSRKVSSVHYNTFRKNRYDMSREFLNAR